MYQNFPYYNDNSQLGGYVNYPQQNFKMPQVQAQVPGLKGRPVTSLEEARAAQIDLDGSLFIFPDLSNNRIYTKQLGIDGTAPLKVYELVEQPIQVQTDYVTREELNETINQLLQRFENAETVTVKQTTAPVPAHNF